MILASSPGFTCGGGGGGGKSLACMYSHYLLPVGNFDAGPLLHEKKNRRA